MIFVSRHSRHFLRHYVFICPTIVKCFFVCNIKEPDSTEGHTTGHVAQPQPPRLEDVKKWNGGTNSPKGLWIRLFDRWLYPPPVNTERSP